MEDEVPQDPQLIRAQKIFLLRLSSPDSTEHASLQVDILEEILKKNLLTTYLSLSKEFGWAVDSNEVDRMTKEIDEEIKKLDDKIEDAKENLGENEVREALLAKADYFISIGDKERALTQLEVTKEKTVAVGQKMDLAFLALRIAFYHLDFPLIVASLENAKKLFEQGGDWERKNRLKVYEGLHCLSSRHFKRAAELFLDSIATFTTTELMPYKDFVFYAVLVSVVSLDRVALKQKVMDAPEVLAVIDQIPHLSDFLNSLHACNYKAFFLAFSGLSADIRKDRYLHPHFRHYLREVRLVAYTQFLEPYKSVAVSAMARAFGVSVDFIDKELSMFIASGRINCKIDKVAGVLETNRPDVRNAQYQALIRQGDLLLNRVQKLSRVIDV